MKITYNSTRMKQQNVYYCCLHIKKYIFFGIFSQ